MQPLVDRVDISTAFQKGLLSLNCGGEATQRLLEQCSETPLLKGHFLLYGGTHSDYFLRVSVLGWQNALKELVAPLAAHVSTEIDLEGAVVVTPETADYFVAIALEEHWGISPVVLATTSQKTPLRVRRTRAPIPCGSKIVLVTDTLISGLRVAKMLNYYFNVVAHVSFARVTQPHAFVLTECPTPNPVKSYWLLNCNWPTVPADACQNKRELLYHSDMN